MSTIITLTGLTVDEVIQVRVAAHNDDGWGEYSEINTSGATIETEPLEMNALSYDSSATTNTAIKLTWTEPSGTSAGGSSVSIDSFTIEWDQGTGTTWQTLPSVVAGIGYYILDSPTYTLTGGNDYQFKILAVNKYGDGASQTTATTITTG